MRFCIGPPWVGNPARADRDEAHTVFLALAGDVEHQMVDERLASLVISDCVYNPFSSFKGYELP